MYTGLVSRKQALDLIKEHSYLVRYDGNSIEYGMTLTGIEQALNELPSVQPKEKTGKWIIIDDTEQFTAKCSECGRIVDSRDIHYWGKDFAYCGKCGAKMEV